MNTAALISPIAPLKPTEREDWLAKVPLPVFGSSLGLLGACLLSENSPQFARLHLLPLSLLAAGTIALLAGIGLHLCRWVLRSTAFRRDMMSPALSPFLAQIGIALLLLAEALHARSPGAANLAFSLGTSVTLVSCVWWAYRLVRVPFSLSNVSPGWLVPGIAVLYVGLLAPTQGHQFLALPALLIGLALSLLSLIALCVRLVKGPSIARLVMPALAIAVALPGLLLVWVAQHRLGMSSIGAVLFWVTLVGYSLGILGFTIAYRRIQFSVSWWGFGMPLTAASIGLIRADATFNLALSNVAASATAILSMGITMILLVRTCRSGWQEIRRPVIASAR